MPSLYARYKNVSEKKGSLLCAGLDPVDFRLGRGNEGLPPDYDKEDWCVECIASVAPYVCAIKLNTRYWLDRGDEDVSMLKRIIEFAKKDHGLLVIEDSKLSDIGSTNDAGIYYADERGADTLTIAPYAGNMEETQRYALKRGIDLITMCLISNPEFELQKNKLVPVNDSEEFDESDIVKLGDGRTFVKQYTHDAKTAADCGIAGIVIGVSNHVTSYEVSIAMRYSRDDTLVLMPDIGAQGGEIEGIREHIPSDNLIVNVGRGLIFPNGSESEQKEQAQAAKNHRDMINSLR